MAGKRQLPPVRIATEDDAPEPPMSLSRAISSGTRLDELKALRRIMTAHLESDVILAREVAALANQLRSVSKEIEELEMADKPDALGKAAGTGDERFDPRAV